MRYGVICFAFLAYISPIFTDSLNKVRELIVEEEIQSEDGIVKEKKKFKIGKAYINESKRTAKFFVGDKVAGSITEGGKLSLEKPVGVKSTIKLDLGTARFRVKKLKNEAFVVRTPAATAGVRGTAFSIYLEGNQEKITLPEGELEIIREDQKISLLAGQKVNVTETQISSVQQMSPEEQESEMNYILEQVRYQNLKIEKALESYEKKIKDYKGKIESGKSKEAEKVKKVIESEIKKAERSGDIRMLDQLNRVKENLNLKTMNLAVNKAQDDYRKLDKLLKEKYQPYMDREHDKIEKLFKDEISQAIKDKQLDLARDLDAWKDDSSLSSSIFKKYISTKEGAPVEFRPDGLVRLRGQPAKYDQRGNYLTVTVTMGQYKDWTDVFLTRDRGMTYHLVHLDKNNAHQKSKTYEYGQSDYVLTAMHAKLYSKYIQTQGGDVWNFYKKPPMIKRKRDTVLYKIEDNLLHIMKKDKGQGMLAIWETRDGGKSFRLIRNQSGSYPYDKNFMEIKAVIK